MSFLNPFFLWGAGLVAVPILIHLIFRQTYRKQVWAAMEFLLRAFQKTRRKLLLENLLLLVLRVLAVVLLVLAFARPVVRLALPGLRQLARGERDLILVVDTSYSMSYREGAKSVFDRAIEEAVEFVGKLEGKGSVALLTANDRPELLLEYSPNHETVIKTLKALKATGGSTDIGASLRKIEELIVDPRFKARGKKRVVLLTDLTRNGWLVKGRKVGGVEGALQALAARVEEFLLVDLGHARPALNLSVDRLYTADKIVGHNFETRFVARIANRGTQEARDVRVHFLVGGAKRDSRVIPQLKARSPVDVDFAEVFARAGPTWVTVQVEGDKHLVVDNRRHHAFGVVERIKVLLVDGDPHEWGPLAETHFLVNALAPQVSRRNPIRHIFEPRQVDRQQFHRTRLAGSGYDLVVLANVSYLSEEKEIELARFVERGGGLLVFLGDMVRPDIYNKRLFGQRRILPAKLADKPAGVVGPNAPRHQLVPLDFGHPMFSFFKEFQYMFTGQDEATSLIGMWYPVTPEESRQVTVLARYSDKDRSPAIVERQLGLGKVVLVTTGADMDWHLMVNSDLYLPLVHEVVYYLISRLAAARNLTVHSPIEFSLREHAKEIRLARPDAQGNPREKADRQRQATSDRSELFRYEQTDQPGVYRLELDHHRTTATGQETQEKKLAYYAVGLDPEEGDLEHLGRAGLVKLYPLLDRRPFAFSRSARAAGQGAGTAKEGEIWHILLLLALSCLVAESSLATWMGRN